jgi:superfamily II DNA or RNA helicase
MLTEKIKIVKHNESYVKLFCEKHISKELHEYFSFFVPGYQFVPAYRNKIWNGKIYLYHIDTNLIYHGLLPYIENFCKERDYSLEYGDPRPDLTDDYPVYHADKFITELDLQSRGQPIGVRDYQKSAYIHSMRNKRALLLSPTSSGKSLIIYLLIRQILEYKCKKGLIIVPTTSLVEQLYSDFADYSTANGWKVEDNVHRIYQGKDKHTDLPLTVSTWQSLYTQPNEYFEQFDFILGDEAHLFKAQSLVSIMSNCINAKYRIGLTGTLDGTKTHKLVLEGLFGPVEKVTTTKELMDNKQIADFSIKCLVLKHEDEICKLMKDKTYQEEIEYIILNEARNKFIKNLAVSLNGNSLILYQYVDKHGKILYDMITNTEKIGNRKVFFVYGKTDTETREEVRRITEEENDAIIVASYGTFSTGINIRNLHNIIFASPSKSRVRNLQSIGRGLRIGDNKVEAVLYDIADDLRYKGYMNFTLKHFVERTKIYNEEKFTYKLYKIGLKNGNNKIITA